MREFIQNDVINGRFIDIYNPEWQSVHLPISKVVVMDHYDPCSSQTGDILSLLPWGCFGGGALIMVGRRLWR